jgi:hypothetical protein
MKQNFEFLTKEEEECGLLCISDVGEKKWKKVFLFINIF